ncbi:thioredoxin family protein [Holdemania massiliensis]|uniref:thioredoxin family protein n=1 Tax=Holdemania massiliensis TaxID=1468449 RepID=UPI001F06C327|nr:thioredoxin domain-containing protein [Holdemania massiliensis]MCH1941424.1 thioredoxin [Holdemania massiliensis]
MATVITKDNFDQEVAGSQLPVILDFQAPWCMYCRRLAPVIAKLEKELEGQVRFGTVDIDEQPELEERFDISTIPSLILFQAGKNGTTLVNPPSRGAIMNWLKEQGI